MKLKSPENLRSIFAERGIAEGDSVITLAMVEAGLGFNRLYDGSWSEWDGAEGVPVTASRG